MIIHSDAWRVIIATGLDRPSTNRKTGNQIQIWILPALVDPIHAVQTGHDTVICGECPLRGRDGKERACYVNIGQAPLSIWRAWKAGKYPAFDVEAFRGSAVRFGAYGDPVHLPLPILKCIAAVASGWTGYTHHWRDPLRSGYREFLMASCETADDAQRAHWRGWRTFRFTRLPVAGEIECPSVTRGVQCADCQLCAGASKSAKSIFIRPHGSGAKFIKS